MNRCYKDPVVIERLLLDGKSVKEVAVIHNVTPSTIYAFLRKSKITLLEKTFRHQDKIGRTFGFLTVVKLVKSAKGSNRGCIAICNCSNCGKKDFETLLYRVISGEAKSCGCRIDFYQKFTGENSSQFTGYREIRGSTWYKIKCHAKSRNLELKISIKDVWNLYEKQNGKCALSGVPIKFGKITRNKGDISASLDRIDSSRGYTLDNIQLVHKDINAIKSNFSEEYFVMLCNIIYQESIRKLDRDT